MIGSSHASSFVNALLTHRGYQPGLRALDRAAAAATPLTSQFPARYLVFDGQAFVSGSQI